MLMAYLVFLASSHLFIASKVSHCRTGSSGEHDWETIIPTHAANRVLGGHIPSSAPTLSGRFSSGERLLLTPLGLSFGALIPEELGSTSYIGNGQHDLA